MLSDYKAGYAAGQACEAIPDDASPDWLSGYEDGQAAALVDMEESEDS